MNIDIEGRNGGGIPLRPLVRPEEPEPVKPVTRVSTPFFSTPLGYATIGLGGLLVLIGIILLLVMVVKGGRRRSYY
jgi:hypothetical protein